MLVPQQIKDCHGPGLPDCRGHPRQILTVPDQETALGRSGVEPQLLGQLGELHVHEQAPQTFPIRGARLQGLQVHLQRHLAFQQRQAAAQAGLLGILAQAAAQGRLLDLF